MIVCPNCNHQNPEGASQCEACYAPMPATVNCSNCGATVQADATFCGQCGFNLKSSISKETAPGMPEAENLELEGAAKAETLVSPEESGSSAKPLPAETSQPPLPSAPPAFTPVAAATSSAATQLQLQKASLLHLQTDTRIELPQGLAVIHLGKPNERIPPDIDLSGLPDSDIVSRIHADIRVEGDAYYLEDVGSTNGTYINHAPLLPGNRHRLRPGDRIALGKGDKMSFIFQMS